MQTPTSNTSLVLNSKFNKLFDWEFYVWYNKDLIESGINTKDKAILHWNKFGKKENRKYYDLNFDWEYYIALHPDLLQHNINTKSKAICHWRDNGEAEQRIAIDHNFDWKYYIFKYSNLVENGIHTKEQAICHWINIGKPSGLIGKNIDDIDINYYFKKYNQIKWFNMNTIEKAQLHWYIFGRHSNYLKSEKHELNEDLHFNWEYYILFNNLSKYIFNKQSAITHWEETGKKQGFVCSNFAFKQTYDQVLQYTILPEVNVDLSLKYKNNYIIHDKDDSSILDVDDIIFTNKYNTPNFKPLILIPSMLSILEQNKLINNQFILIIDFGNFGGGTTFFINLIISKYKKETNFLIARNFNGIVHFYINDDIKINNTYLPNDSVNFLYQHKKYINKIFINSIVGHDDIFINSLFLLEKPIDIITHDYSIIFKSPQMYFHEITSSISNNQFIKLNNYHNIITQNIENLYIYRELLNNQTNAIVTTLPDFTQKNKQVFKTNSSKLIIGILGNITSIKGYYVVEKIIDFTKFNPNIEVIIFGKILNLSYIKQYPYNNIHELNELLEKYKPNLWVETSLWPETYSYTLSIMMITELPIYYHEKQYPSVIKNRLSNYQYAYEFKNIDIFIENLNNTSYDQPFSATNISGKSEFWTIHPTIYYNSFWDNYFGNTNTIKNINDYYVNLNNSNVSFKNNSLFNPYLSQNKFNIAAYCVYFPQFHYFTENDINFYPGFTDINNIDHLTRCYPNIDVETPSNSDYDLKNIMEYNLTANSTLIQKQIDILYKYGMQGFAMYYYWFSCNTITNKNMLMADVIDQFFLENLDAKNRKIFFIWANEDWTKNPAFGHITDKIENKYNANELQPNIDNLIRYFKHANYLKIDNKPVFFLHHPWFLTQNELDEFKLLLATACISEGFNGVYFLVNSIDKIYDNHLHYDFHFNYKKNKSSVYFDENKQRCLDYKKYINQEIKYNSENIKTVVFDFDNRPRLCLPDRLQFSTICANISEIDQCECVKRTVSSYENTEDGINKIMLINGWNEWGERMAVEPSNNRGFYYLNMLRHFLSI